MEKLKYKVREHVFMLVGSTIKDGYVIGRTETITEVPCYKVAFIDEDYAIKEQVFLEEDLHSSIPMLFAKLENEYMDSLRDYENNDPLNFLIKECSDKYGV